MHWFTEPIKNRYADFSGRTGRQAYWMFALVSLLLQIAVYTVDIVIGTSFLGLVFFVLIAVPSFAIAARRLHDIGKSGWWQLISFVPLVGIIVLIVLLSSKSKSGDNEYGQGAAVSGMPPAEPTPAAVAAPESSNTQQGIER
jgi:uncharacterized membrane protein YhaH (DUF805 family)